MAMPFTDDGYTDQEADAIHQTIQPYLKPDIQWDHLREEITNDIRAICTRASVLYTGDIQRHETTLEVALEAALRAYEQSSEPERFHLERQGSDYLPILDDETALRVSSMIDALVKTVRQARRPPFDAPYAYAQERGAPMNHTMVLLVTHLLHVFNRATGIEPTVFAQSRLNSRAFARAGQEDDTRTEYKGRANPFLLACLAPLKLVPPKQLPSAILAVYRQAKPGMLATKKAWGDQLNALAQGSTPQQDSKK